MPVDYMEVIGTLGVIASKHPQTVGMLANTYSSYKDIADEIDKLKNEYQQSAKAATGKLDKAGILMQLVALHPNVIKFLAQTLSTWQTRIPDLIQILNEFEASSTAAYKS